MARNVTVQSGYNNIQLPNGVLADEGDTVTLTDEEFAQLDSDLLGTQLSDDGPASESGDQVVSQGTAVADIADPATATATDNANKINELLGALRGAGRPLAE